ncbi:MAG: hypothetical protein V4739_04130 [Pseudomonadota bacterium]
MQVILNTDPHVDGRHQMAEHLETVVKESLGRFGEHITRVEAHFANASSHHQSHVDEVYCTLEARLVHLEPVVVKDHADTAHQALQGSLSKLKRAVTTVLGKQDRSRSGAAGPTDLDLALGQPNDPVPE